MTWDPTPWAIGGGAEHSPDVARQLAYAATTGAEGVVNAPDLKVTSAGGMVLQVQAGAALILSHAAGGADQTYVARNATLDTSLSLPTPGATARSDMIIARVEDPFMAGEPWSTPVDPTSATYVSTAVISGVASTDTVPSPALNYSAIPLARVDIPAGATAITDAMITDLREVAIPRSYRKLLVVTPTVTQVQTATSYTLWPTQANFTVKVPTWANYAIVTGELMGIKVNAGNQRGGVRVRVGTKYSDGTATDVDVAAGFSRVNVKSAAPMLIPEAMRGTVVPVQTQAMHTSGSANLISDAYSSVIVDIEFIERAE